MGQSTIAVGFVLFIWGYILYQEIREERREMEKHKAFKRWAIKDSEILEKMFENGPNNTETRDVLIKERKQNEDELDNFMSNFKN